VLKSLIIIVTTGAVSFAFTDVKSDSAFLSLMLPVVVLLSAIALAIWVVLLVHRSGIDQHVDGRNGDIHAPIAPDDFLGPGDGGDGV
jgi:hypothetical protein